MMTIMFILWCEYHCEGGLWVGFLAANIIAINDYWILTFSIIKGKFKMNLLTIVVLSNEDEKGCRKNEFNIT